MTSFPSIQIRQTYAKLGFDADPGAYDIKQPKAAVQMHVEPGRLDIHSPSGELHVDSSKAWDALCLGGNLEMMHRIYSQAHDIVLQGIARIVENGNRLAAIHTHENAIAAIAQEQAYEFSDMEYAGPASFDNVDVTYIAHPPEIEYTPGTVQIQVQVNPPEISYHRGKWEAYMVQYPRVDITPPQIDVKR